MVAVGEAERKVIKATTRAFKASTARREQTVKRKGADQHHLPRDVSAVVPNPNASVFSLASPLTRRSLRTIRNALPTAYSAKDSIGPLETHTGVMIPCRNLNDNLGLPLEVCVWGGGEGTGEGGGVDTFRRSQVRVLLFLSSFSAQDGQASQVEGSTRLMTRFCAPP